MYNISSSSKTPLHIQLFKQLKQDIEQNFKAGDKLNSIRKVASLYNLSKNTVESAYSQLVAEGYIESYPKSGYLVTDTYYKDSQTTISSVIIQENEKENYLYDFIPARLEKGSFPLKLWKRIFTKVIDESLDFGTYSSGQGEFALREQIAKYIIQSRGVKCQTNQVIVCGGLADSLSILARILHKTHNTLAIENPGYYVAKNVFESFGYNINKIPLDENGISIEALNLTNAKLVYTTPSHQYPTGVAIPISNRLKLLHWAKDKDALIIEDDYDSELSYDNRPIPSLQGLDKNDKVVYIGTFSKSLCATLRISYMVLPQHLMKEYNKLYDAYFSSVPLMMQKTMEHFMSEGHWDRHLRKIRTLNRKKHNLMRSLLKDTLCNTIKIESSGAGLAILINPTVDFDWDKLKKITKEKKMKLYFAKDKSGGDWEAIRMGFGGFTEKELPLAMKVFFKIWEQCIVK